MRTMWWLYLIGLLVPNIGQAQAAADSTELVRLEGVWNRAHVAGHADSLASLWDATLVVAVPGMSLLDRAGSLQMAQGGHIKFHRYETADLRIRVSGDAAVVEGQMVRDRERSGRRIVDRWSFTKVYRRSAGRWQVTAFVATLRP